MSKNKWHWIFGMGNTISCTTHTKFFFIVSLETDFYHTTGWVSIIPCSQKSTSCSFNNRFHWCFHAIISLGLPEIASYVSRAETTSGRSNLKLMPTWKQQWKNDGKNLTLTSMDREYKNSSHSVINSSVFMHTRYKNSICAIRWQCINNIEESNDLKLYMPSELSLWPISYTAQICCYDDLPKRYGSCDRIQTTVL